jgi:hypothetical protein
MEARLPFFVQRLALDPKTFEDESVVGVETLGPILDRVAVPRTNRDNPRSVPAKAASMPGCQDYGLQTAGQLIPSRQECDELLDIALEEHVPIALARALAVNGDIAPI